MNQTPRKKRGSDRCFTTEAAMKLIRPLANLADHEAFDLDPCADELSCWGEKFFTKKDDGLLQLWHGRVFCNPPWSNVAPWVEKAWQELVAFRALSVTFLLPDNRHGTPWWQTWIEPYRDSRAPSLRIEMPWGEREPYALVHPTTFYLPGRTRYGSTRDPKGLKAKSPPFGSVVIHLENAEVVGNGFLERVVA